MEKRYLMATYREWAGFSANLRVREDLTGMTASFPKSVIPLRCNMDGTVLTGRRHEFTPVLLINHGPHISPASLVAQLVKNPPAMWETWV